MYLSSIDGSYKRQRYRYMQNTPIKIENNKEKESRQKQIRNRFA